MLRVPTVLVVGAGASCELGFPDGPDLLRRIAVALDIRFEAYRQIKGDHAIMGAFSQIHANAQTKDLNEYLHAGWRIRDGAVLGRSIDYVIDQSDDDPKVEIAGKLAICSEILRAERHSKLGDRAPGAPKSRLAEASDTWLLPLAQALTTGLRRSAADRVFENLTIISFNYDRSVEVYLALALEAYGLEGMVARRLVTTLPIYHPYGQVGRLPWWPGSGPAVEFGGGGKLDELIPNIRTFTERQQEGTSLDAMRLAVTKAKQIVFLGFAFHEQNMDLIRPVGEMEVERITGTAFREEPPTVEVMRSAIRSIISSNRINSFPINGPQLQNLTCRAFFDQHFRAITS